MGASFSFPDLNAPLFHIDNRLPPITRWVVLTAIVGFIVWLVFFLMDKNKHGCHEKACKRLNCKYKALVARMDRHFPESASVSSPDSP